MERMLNDMSAIQWLHWKTYMSLNPFDEARADVRAAQICQAFVNMWRDTKSHPDPLPLEQFILKFGDAAEPAQAKRQQTPEEIERIVSDWVLTSNMIIAEKERHGG